MECCPNPSLRAKGSGRKAEEGPRAPWTMSPLWFADSTPTRRSDRPAWPSADAARFPERPREPPATPPSAPGRAAPTPRWRLEGPFLPPRVRRLGVRVLHSVPRARAFF
jgi:hypothetical protein